MQVARIPSRVAIALIRLYQLTLGRLLPPRCRFHPTCSHYAIESIDRRGLIRGGVAAGWRLVRCGPWSRGGLDPVKLRHKGPEAAHG